MTSMDMDGERARCSSDCELGEAESSGVGAGGKTKWNVLDAIWIWDLSLRRTRLPLPAHTPSTQAPFLPTTTRTKESSSLSHSILACKRETLLSLRSMSTRGDVSVEVVESVRTGFLPMVRTERVWR